MFRIDLEQGGMVADEEFRANLATSKPYKQWIESLRIRLDDVSFAARRHPQAQAAEAAATEARRVSDKVSLLDRQQAFGFTQEDLKFLIAPMATASEESVGSMGNDSPLVVLSDKNKPLYNYLNQLFAPLTNQPFGPIR